MDGFAFEGKVDGPRQRPPATARPPQTEQTPSPVGTTSTTESAFTTQCKQNCRVRTFLLHFYSTLQNECEYEEYLLVFSALKKMLYFLGFFICKISNIQLTQWRNIQINNKTCWFFIFYSDEIFHDLFFFKWNIVSLTQLMTVSW